MSKNWTYSSKLCFFKNLPQFVLSGSSARIMGVHTPGAAVRNHISSKGQEIYCNKSNCVPFVVPGLSTSSSTTHTHTHTPTSSSSSSQDSVFDVNRYTENTVQERSGSTSDELRGNPMHKPTETENKDKNEGPEEVQSDLLHDLPDWLQEFRENLVDERSPLEPRGNLAPEDQDNHQWSCEQKWNRVRVSIVSTRTFRRPKLWYLLEHENNGGLLQKTYWYSFEDLAIQWIQSYPCKTKTAQETQKKIMKFLEPTRKPKVIYTDNSLELGKWCEELS